jgi:hypothetical protein
VGNRGIERADIKEEEMIGFLRLKNDRGEDVKGMSSVLNIRV